MTPEIQTPSPFALLTIARQAARAAGEHVLANLNRRGEADSLTRSDVKHRLDVEAQEVATATILAACPDYPILGEETCDRPLPDAPVRWVIDPIDGTVNFFHGSPWWCCSVAAQVNGRSVAGAVFAPEFGWLFEASSDGPSLCNGARLRVSTLSEPQMSLIHTGADKADLGEHSFRFMRAVAALAQRARITGSAALDMCLVASGKAEAYFEPGVYIWDIAAAGLIVERAGGVCDVLREYGSHRLAVLASNGLIQSRVRDTLLPLFN
jgi:myo-inositol-1(or 4)-monophosphatase